MSEMNRETYYGVLRDFKGGQFESISQDYHGMCRAQDEMIRSLQEKGATIKGWKIVDENEVFIISPIFDFQLVNNQNHVFSPANVTGFEVELCYQAVVPESVDEVEAVVNASSPKVAIEVMREKINPLSHIACDFFFNYGIIVADASVVGDFQFNKSGSDEVFEYQATDSTLLAEKQYFLKQGLIECVRRGYQGEFFFMTGSLNGMLAAETRLGSNAIVDDGQAIIRFDVAN
ncbi:hypothetical protein [Marinomonas pollencensis]|uniref:2-keto-4-pentenoate hydratase n=1 Tax=Marinomonas pollencensis TaxID=491954 RepID=A0A3E0DNT3_9GAMM|nr:hypothetical protein [Marinomonas pollencensis]REG84419.1 hypothetical protein DFP81_104303 [Marinomonas pollencensis]